MTDAPCCIEAEQAVLGAVLFDNDVYLSVTEHVQAEHFFDPVHEWIFETIGRMLASGRTVTPHLVMQAMGNEPAIMAIGGERYLTDLVRAVPSTIGAPDYARTVREKFLLRGIQSAATSMLERVGLTNLDHDPLAQLELAQQQLFELGNASSDNRPVSVGKAAQSFLAEYDEYGSRSISTGIYRLDQAMGQLVPQDLVVLAGRPSMGKTAVAVEIAKNVAEQGHGVLIFSFEMGAQSLSLRVMSSVWRHKHRVPYEMFADGRAGPEDRAAMRQAADYLNTVPMVIDERSGLDVARLRLEVRRQMAMMKRRNIDLKLVMIDYLQLMELGERRGENEAQALGRTSKALKQLARDLDVCVLLLSQLNRDVEKRDPPEPQMSDLRASGRIEEDADKVLLLYRPEYYLQRSEPDDGPDGSKEHNAWMDWRASLGEWKDKLKVIIAKRRMGPVGVARLRTDMAVSAIEPEFPEVREVA